MSLPFKQHKTLANAHQIGTLTWVTGGTAGIGMATACQVNSRGAPDDMVVVSGRDSDRAAQSVSAIKATGPAMAKALVCDQASPASIKATCRSIVDLKPRRFNLVANVGWNPVHDFGPRKVQNLDSDLLRMALEVNVVATASLIAAVLPFMRSVGGGTIVLVGSKAYKFGLPGQLSYNTSKAALVGIKNSIAAEYGRNGVRCHLINPGIVINERTEALRRNLEPINGLTVLSEAHVASRIIDLLALGPHCENGQEIDL